MTIDSDEPAVAIQRKRSNQRVQQAIVVVHGMGDKKPTSTLMRFFGAAFPPREDYPTCGICAQEQSKQRSTDVNQEVAPTQEQLDTWRIPPFYSMPDRTRGHLDQRHLIVSQHPNRRSPTIATNHVLRPWAAAAEDIDDHHPQTDVYEYHWSHLFTGNRFSHLGFLFRRLLFRSANREDLPAQALTFVALLFLIAVAAGVVFAATAGGLLASIAGLVGLPVVLLVFNFAARDFGDVARYLSLAPADLKARREIHNGLSDLLGRLHERQEYQRIVVVAHSLGSVIAYDALSHLWPDLAMLHANPDRHRGRSDQPALRALEAAAHDLVNGSLERAEPTELARLRATYRTRQLDFWREQRSLGNPWLITDFITLGSPMRFAHLLLASDRSELEELWRRRELPTCPPWREYGSRLPDSANASQAPRLDAPFVFSWPNGKVQVPNQGAVFSSTRWTNIYFKRDSFAGPLWRNFGDGIEDREILPRGLTRSRLPLVAHTRYFSTNDHGHPCRKCSGARDERLPEAIAELRAALALDSTTLLKATVHSPLPDLDVSEVEPRHGRPPQDFGLATEEG